MDIKSVEKFFEEICLSEDNLVGGTDSYLPKVPKGVKAEAGCSKLVFVFDESPFVLKVPCLSVDNDEEDGCLLSKCDRCDGDGECPCSECSNFRPKTSTLSQNYCELEEKIFQKAKKENLERFFCETTYLGEVNDIPVYIQEKCEFPGQHNTKKTPSKDSLNLVREKEWIFDLVYDAFVVDFYGEEFYKRLIRFIDDNGIDDFHPGNMGFRLNGEPCIYDYSGFEG